jgi:uncharacterized membrane protein YtjA (UPF0391 family)
VPTGEEELLAISLSLLRALEEDSSKGGIMFRWAIGFFVIALLAALLGFSGIAVAFAGIAKILFYIFVVLFVITLAGHLFRGA